MQKIFNFLIVFAVTLFLLWYESIFLWILIPLIVICYLWTRTGCIPPYSVFCFKFRFSPKLFHRPTSTPETPPLVITPELKQLIQGINTILFRCPFTVIFMITSAVCTIGCTISWPWLAVVPLTCLIGEGYNFSKITRKYHLSLFGKWEIPENIIDNLRKSFLSEYPRQSLLLSDYPSVKKFCHYWKTPFDASIALELADLLQLGFVFYPQDAFVFLYGNERKFKAQLFARFKRKIYFNDLKTMNVQEVIDTIKSTFSYKYTILPEALEPFPDILQDTPPLSPAMAEVWQMSQTGMWEKWKESLFIKEIEKRPPLSEKLFISYWPDAERAAIALEIRQAAVNNFSRPETMMCYPNDPLPLLAYVNLDSMETVEFVMELESRFNIRIKDEDYGENIVKSNFSQLVEYIYSKVYNSPVQIDDRLQTS